MSICWPFPFFASKFSISFKCVSPKILNPTHFLIMQMPKEQLIVSLRYLKHVTPSTLQIYFHVLKIQSQHIWIWLMHSVGKEEMNKLIQVQRSAWAFIPSPLPAHHCRFYYRPKASAHCDTWYCSWSVSYQHPQGRSLLCMTWNEKLWTWHSNTALA